MMPTHDNELNDAAGGEARYANFFKVGYNAFEFLLAFGQSYADNEQEQVHTRLVMSPGYAKELLRVLNQSLADYERDFGTIKEEC
jgi:Protein of unknown function (DUF3467)